MGKLFDVDKVFARFSPSFCIFLIIFGRTDLRIVVSKAKFDAEADFDVHLAPAPRKSSQIDEKLIFRSENFADFFCSASKNKMLGMV